MHHLIKSFASQQSPSTRKFGWNWPTPLHNADFQSIFARSASAVPLMEKSSVIANSKSTMRCPVSLRWTACVGCPKPLKGDSKMKNGRFSSKSALFQRNSATKFLYVKITGLYQSAEMVGGKCPFKDKFSSYPPATRISTKEILCMHHLIKSFASQQLNTVWNL